jgi:hypothetical protein
MTAESLWNMPVHLTQADLVAMAIIFTTEDTESTEEGQFIVIKPEISVP